MSAIKVLENTRLGIENGQAMVSHISKQRVLEFKPSRIFKFNNDMYSGDKPFYTTCFDVDKQTGNFVLAGHTDGRITLYNKAMKLKNPDFLFHPWLEILTLPKRVSCVKWFGREFFLSCQGGEKNVNLWDATALNLASSFASSGSDICQFDVSLCGMIASGLFDGSVVLHKMDSGSGLTIKKAHDRIVHSCHWSVYNSNLLATAGADNMARLWDIRNTRKCVLEFNRTNYDSALTTHTRNILAVRFVKGGGKILTFSKDKLIKMWSTVSGKKEMIHFDHYKPNRCDVLNVAIVDHYKLNLAFVPSSKNVSVYNIDTGKRVTELKGHIQPVVCCAYNYVHQELYTSSTDGKLIWRSESDLSPEDEKKFKFVKKWRYTRRGRQRQYQFVAYDTEPEE